MLFHVWAPKNRLVALTGQALAVLAWIPPSVLLYSSSDAAPTGGTDVATCARVGDAMLKTAQTPYSSMSTITVSQPGSDKSGGDIASRTSETIFTGDAVFVRFGSSHWRKMNIEIGALQELVRKASSKLSDCRDLGIAQVRGGPATVLYALEASAPSASGTQTKLWVDKATGTLVRSETETKSAEGTRHSIIEYRYGNVAAPQLEN